MRGNTVLLLLVIVAACGSSPPAREPLPSCTACRIEVRNAAPYTYDLRVGDPHSGMMVGTVGPARTVSLTLEAFPQQLYATREQSGQVVVRVCPYVGPGEGVYRFECRAR